MRELEYITDEDGRRYPTDQPFTQRDQGHRAADELVYVVISDVADVLRAEANRLVRLADRADELTREAAALWGEDGPDGWLPMGDEDDGEKLQDILRDAESLDDVYVEWCADAGTVLVTLSRYWEDYEEEGEGE